MSQTMSLVMSLAKSLDAFNPSTLRCNPKSFSQTRSKFALQIFQQLIRLYVDGIISFCRSQAMSQLMSLVMSLVMSQAMSLDTFNPSSIRHSPKFLIFLANSNWVSTLDLSTAPPPSGPLNYQFPYVPDNVTRERDREAWERWDERNERVGRVFRIYIKGFIFNATRSTITKAYPIKNWQLIKNILYIIYSGGSTA